MPDTSFDRWTRRRFGQAAGALITVPLLAGAASPVDAKHHKKKKKPKKGKCLNFQDGACLLGGNFCNPYGSPCCDCLKCRGTKDEYIDENGDPAFILQYNCSV